MYLEASSPVGMDIEEGMSAIWPATETTHGLLSCEEDSVSSNGIDIAWE